MKKVFGFFKFIALILALVLSLSFVDRLLSFKTAHGIKQARCLYAQPENTIDVAFLGSSHMHVNINTALLWEKYGIAAYDYSAAEQPLWMTYYYLQELCKYQSPKVVVLDFYAPAMFYDDYQYKYIADNFYGMKFSLNKLRMLKASVEPDRIKDFFPALVSYHARYQELEQADWDYLFESDEDKSSFKGYTPYFKIAEWEKPEFDAEDEEPLTAKSQEYLDKIIDYCNEKGIQMFFIVTPYIKEYYADQRFQYVENLCAQRGIMFEDGNAWYETLGLDFSKDYFDFSHLNYTGSCKYTDYLGAGLKYRFDIPDHRGDPAYESWDRNVIEIEKEVAEQGW
ncbi:MAG: hypothetical protein IJI01_13595 [Butyrivibrio sp.]|uniref:hypothetical protein n=1 Tax=Butyrivibrio sp. TaxID=28121 RepID=UPI0025BF744A|nr:hypothetical protein [Butyrivibrio sp.]MBQ6589692.1 hypothetical protein [Butyrivibrio sp.]